MLCIKNGLIHDAVSATPYVGDILVENGKITQILPANSCKEAETVIDATGHNVYPGLVDAHSHLGLDGYAIGFEGQDYNEMNDILTPQLRAIDGINPQDETLQLALEGGVTCVGTGPGSSNVLGGMFVAMKPFGRRIDDMIVKFPVAMKCAFGENPKRCYKDKNNYSRMSTASKLREMLFKAREYQAKLDAAAEDPSKKPAYDMKLEALLPVLRREIPLKAHAHRADDIFTAIRIAKEFDVKLTIEHCTDGALIAEDLAKENYPVAVGPSFGHATKYELKNKSIFFAIVVIFFISLQPQNIFSYLVSKRIKLDNKSTPIQIGILLQILVFRAFSFCLDELSQSLFYLLYSSHCCQKKQGKHELPFQKYVLSFH